MLKALEQYMAEAASLQAGSAHRLHAARYVLTSLIAQLPRHGPLLSLIKAEYETSIAPILARAPPPPHQLWTVHPLQLQATKHEADLRHIKSKLRRADADVLVAARQKALLRTACLEVCRRVQNMGTDAPGSVEAQKRHSLAYGSQLVNSLDRGGGSGADAKVLAQDMAVELDILQLMSEPIEQGVTLELVQV